MGTTSLIKNGSDTNVRPTGVRSIYNPAAMFLQSPTNDRVITFLEGLAGGVVVLAVLVARLWHPGMGEMLSDSTKGDWILLGTVFGTLLVLIALLFTLK